MQMDLTISPLSWQGYVDLFGQAYRPNLLQSPLYAKMARLVYGQTSRPYAIQHAGQPIGLVNLQQASIMRGLVHGLICDRGPLWLSAKYEQNINYHQAFYTWLADEFPRRFGRRRRIIPETTQMSLMGQLQNAGWRHHSKSEPYQTIWIDIQPEEEALFASLKAKRRNAIRKSMRSDLEIKWSSHVKDAAMILAHHQADRRERAYKGASMRSLSVLIHQAAASGDLLVGLGMLYGHVISGIIILTHGRGATYQVGWSAKPTQEEGLGVNLNDIGASQLLLWQAFLRLSQAPYHVDWLDLGGVNDADAAGVKRFKMGFGGQHITLIGQYG